MKSVVIFDDSRTVRMFVQMALGQAGMTVQAYEELSQWEADEKGEPDLVLLDVNMQGFLGTDLLAHIRKNWPGQPLIYLYSDMKEEELSELADTRGADGYICKAWGYQGLVKAVEQAL